MHKLAAFVSVLVLAPTVATAATWVVDPSGAGDHTTITGALSAAASGDLIEVQAGVYVEDLDFQGKQIELVGVGGSGAVSLVGTGGTEPVVRLSNGEAAGTIIQGFDISGGDTASDLYTGGCLHISGADVVLRDLVVHGCTAHVGGGIWANESTVLLEDVELTDNQAALDSGDDWAYGGGLYASTSIITIDGLHAHANEAERGGGVMFGDSTVEAQDLVLEGNSAVRGGGLSVLGGSVLLVDPWIADNSGSEHSGGAWVNVDGELTIDGGALANNDAGSATAAGFAGGLRVTEATASLDGVLIQSNGTIGPGTDDTGGGLRADNEAVVDLSGCTIEDNDSGFGGGVFATQESELSLVGSRLSGNVARASGGGYYGSTSVLTTTTTVFDGNTAAVDGGAVRAQDGEVVATNAVFIDNVANNGAAIHLFSTAEGTLTHITAVGNAAASGGTVRVTGDSQLELVNSIVAFPTDGSGVSAGDGAITDLRYNDVYVPDGVDWSGALPNLDGVNGNQHAHPAFVDYTADGAWNDDLDIAAASPCVDAGDPSTPADVDGTPPDQGAFGGPDADDWADVLTDDDGDGFSPAAGDCDDSDPTVHPGAEEVCNGADDDCDGDVDEGCDDDDDAADDDDSADDDDAADDDDDADDDDASTGDDDDAADDDDSAPADPPGDAGCGCSAGGGVGVLLLPLLLVRRRAA